MGKLKRPALLLGIFLVVLAAHAFSPVKQSADSRFVIHVALNIVEEGTTNVDNYESLLASQNYYNIETYGGHKYIHYSLGPDLMAVPFVAVADAWYHLRRGHGYRQKIENDIPQAFEKFIASFIVALTAVLVFILADRRLGSVWRSLLVVFVFAFCTSAWSTSSRGLWQHGPSMLVFCGALCLLDRGDERPWLVPLAGLLLAFSYVVRPTNVLAASLLAIFVLVKYPRRFLPMLACAALVLIPFFAYNESVYGSLVSTYYTPGAHTGGDGSFWVALAGHLVSPARGLFVFSPVLLLFFVGVYYLIREKRMSLLDGFVLAVVVLQLVMISFGARWWAGHCFGPRYSADVIPFFVWFLVPVVAKFRAPVTKGVVALAAVFVVLAAASFFVNFKGATNGACIAWNAVPTNVDSHHERLWDWSDLQFMRK